MASLEVDAGVLFSTVIEHGQRKREVVSASRKLYQALEPEDFAGDLDDELFFALHELYAAVEALDRFEFDHGELDG
jgi:hypothetical protein